MGIISDILNAVKNFVVNKIFRPFVEWITNLLNVISVELRIAKHQIIKDIGKWLESDFNFLIAFIGAIVVTVFWPKIWAFIGKLTEKFLQSAMVEAIKEGIGNITNSIFWINVETVNLILKVLWPEYTAMMSKFTEAVSGLADELGEGSGYIHAVFQLQKAVAFNTGALLGLPAEASELEAYTKTAEFTKRIDDRFRRYAYDPGLIYRDFLEEIVIPSATDQKDAQQALVTEIREQHERNVSMNTAIVNIEDAVDIFIDEMPDEIADQIQKRWEPIKEWMDENYHALVDEMLRITDGIASALELRQERVEQANAYAIARVEDPLNAMLAYEFANEEQQATLKEHNLKMIAEGLIEEAEETSSISKPAYDETFAIIADLLRNLPVPMVLKFEPPGFASIPRGPASKENWFIGEY